MTFQYALRFESGERRGEVVPVAIVGAQGGAFTIGRKPGNSLQVTDPSVSGRHAELEVRGEVLAIRDLDSTNGTEVGGRRVRQAELGLGDHFTLGKVEFAVLDEAGRGAGSGPALELEMSEPEDPAGLSQTRIQPREDGFEITEADLARSRRTSKLGPLALVGLAALAGGAYYWSTTRAGDDDGGPKVARPIEAPAGHMLSGYSFENADGWLFDDSTGEPFTRVGGASNTGRRGARVELVGGATALLESEPVRVSSPVRVSAWMRPEAGIEGRLGLRFHGSETLPRLEVWSDAARVGEDFAELAMAAAPPPGYSQVSVLLRGTSTAAEPAEDDEDPPYAELDIDDVALVPDGEAPLVHSQDSWRVLSTIRQDSAARSFAIASLDRTLVPSLLVREAAGALGTAALTASTDGADVVLRPASAGVLELLVHRDLVGMGLATISGVGSASYAGHGPSFDAAGATSVLAGANANLVRLALPSARDVSGRASGDDVVVRFDVAAGEELRLQLDFGEERTLAQRLARRADEERSGGRSGDALRTWSELLSDVPFDTALVQRASTARSEIVEGGRRELKALAGEVERARFFGLEPLYREKLARAQEIRARFRGSEVETQGAALVTEIEGELSALGSNTAAAENTRLEGIAGALRDAGSVGLAGRVDTYRQRESGGDDTTDR